MRGTVGCIARRNVGWRAVTRTFAQLLGIACYFPFCDDKVEEEEAQEKGEELSFLCGCTNPGGYAVFQLRSTAPDHRA